MTVGFLMESALSAQLQGNLAQAADLYRTVLQVQPQNIDALHMLGVIHFTLGELDDAERLIRAADSLCLEPIRIIQHNLMMLREKIAASGSRPSEPVVSVHIDAPDCPVVDVLEVHAAEEITLPALSLPGEADTATTPVETSEQKWQFPPLKAFVLEDAVVDAESAVPADGTRMIVDDHFDPARYQSPEWRHGLYRMSAENDGSIERTVSVESHDRPVLEKAIVLTSGYWVNWAHFLTEVLPKALIADRQAQWRDWPMLISSVGLLNAQRLLELLISPGRPIIKANGRMSVKTAGFVSSVGFCPLEYVYDRETENPTIRPMDCVFSPYALNTVRNAARRVANIRESSASLRLYLRRNGSNRKFINQAEVEQVFLAHGFRIIEPEKLSVRQQIELFSCADVIAGPTGAAIANLVFAPPGCRILVLAAQNTHWPFHYWLNMAHAAGHHARYVFGQMTGTPAHPAHPDLYMPDLEHLDSMIRTTTMKGNVPWS